VKLLKELLLEVQALHPDSTLAVGGLPGDFCTQPAIDPSHRIARRKYQHSKQDSVK